MRVKNANLMIRMQINEISKTLRVRDKGEKTGKTTFGKWEKNTKIFCDVIAKPAPLAPESE